MNYGTFFSTELQKCAFPWDEAVGGGLGLGTGLLVNMAAKPKGLRQLVAPVIGAGVGTLLGYANRKDNEREKQRLRVVAQENSLIDDYLLSNPNAYVKPDYSGAEAEARTAAIYGGLMGAGMGALVDDEDRIGGALRHGAWNAGLSGSDAYYSAQQRAKEEARMHMLRMARAERRKNNAL